MAESSFLPVSAFTIRELTGDKRKVQLVGRGLPYKPFSLSGSQRADFTWYPGSPIATVQTFGAQEEDTTINGMWKDKFLANGGELTLLGGSAQPATVDDEPITTAFDLAQLFDDIRRKGQLVEVTWDRIVRIGLLTKFEQKWHNSRDVEWSATFGWQSQGDRVTDSLYTVDISIHGLASSWANALDSLTNAITAPFQALQSFADSVNNVVNKIKQGVRAIQDAVNSAVSSILAPLDAVRRLVSVVQTIKNAAKELIDTVESLPGQLWAQVQAVGAAVGQAFGSSSSPSITAPAPQTLTTSQVLKAEKYGRDLKLQARAMLSLAATHERQLQKKIDPQLVSIVTAREGQDLRDVARKHYGSPDGWKRLVHANRLKTSKLTAGQVILVPLPTGDRGDC